MQSNAGRPDRSRDVSVRLDATESNAAAHNARCRRYPLTVDSRNVDRGISQSADNLGNGADAIIALNQETLLRADQLPRVRLRDLFEGGRVGWKAGSAGKKPAAVRERCQASMSSKPVANRPPNRPQTAPRGQSAVVSCFEEWE